MRRKRARKQRRSWENPAVPLNWETPDDATYDALGAAKTAAGVRVSRKKALGYPAVWRAVNLISGDVAKLPLVVYRRDGRNRELAPDHPSYPLLVWKPNDAMTAFVLKQTLMAHVLTEGNGYAYIEREGGVKPAGLLLLNPDKTTPIRVDGRLWYVYGDRTGGPKDWDKLPAADVIHLRGLGFDGLQGYPVLRYVADSIGAALAARDYSGRYFENDARPGGVLKSAKVLTDTARRNMRESWERLHTGVRNRHRVAILEEGTDYTPFESNARNAQLLENREFDAREIANIFGVPTHKLGDPSKVAYNSLEQENQSYYDDTLSRWLKLISEECRDKLLTEEEKASESHLIDFDYQEIQRANLTAQVDFVDKLVSRGVLDADEGRAVFGYNARPRQPEPPAPDTEPAPEPAPPSDPPPDGDPVRQVRKSSLRVLIESTARRMLRRLVSHAVKDVRAGAFASWRARAESQHVAVIVEAFDPVLDCVGRDCRLTAQEVADRLIDDTARTLADLTPDQAEAVAGEMGRIAPGRVADSIIGSAA